MLMLVYAQPWSELGTAILECQAGIHQAERNALESLRTEVCPPIVPLLNSSKYNLIHQVGGRAVALRRNARIIDEIDVTAGFAELAAEMNFVRPVVNDRSAPASHLSPIPVPNHLRSLNFLTVNGRHPAVELGLLTSGRVFTPNTVDLGPDSRLMVITGPNMVSKYLPPSSSG